MSITRLHFRTADTQDAPAVARLAGQLGYPIEDDTMRERLAALQAHLGQALYLAEIDGQVVGWIFLIAAPDLLTGPTAEIGGLVVDQAQRGQGIGKALLSIASDWASQQGCTELRVRSNTARDVRVREFYLAAGFELVKTQYVLIKPAALHADR